MDVVMIERYLDEINHMNLLLERQCFFDCFDTFFNIENEMFNPGKDETCYKKFPVRMMVRMSDPTICMQGIKLQTDVSISSHMKFLSLETFS